MRISLRQVRTEYMYFNRKWFDNSLPLDTTFHLNVAPGGYALRSRMGETGTWRKTRGVTKSRILGFHITLSERNCLKHGWRSASFTLLHEMAHIATWRQCRRSRPHGKPFQKEMRRLAAAGAFDDLW